VFWMMYSFFRVIHRRLNFKCQHFRTLCLFHCFIPTRLWRQNWQCSETLAFKQQMPVNHPYLLAYEDRTDSVPKRWHLNNRCRWITHTYSPMKIELTVFRNVGI
jgi:hypothetical protein